MCEPTATGELNLGEILSGAQATYPELAAMTCQWNEPTRNDMADAVQYSVPRVSNFSFLTPSTGVVRYDVTTETSESTATYYLYVRRFEGYEDTINYHVRLQKYNPNAEYGFTVETSASHETLPFTKDSEDSYSLAVSRTKFDGSSVPLMMSVDGGTASQTGFFLTGLEPQKDVWFDLTLGMVSLGITLGEGVKGYKFTDESIVTENGIQSGTTVELEVELEEGYDGLELISDNKNLTWTLDGSKIRFTMPAPDLAVTLRAYRQFGITYEYNYAGYGTVSDCIFHREQRDDCSGGSRD